MKNVRAAAIAVALAFSAPVMAQDSGFYIGGSIGQNSVQDGCTGVGGPGVSCEDTDTAWKIFAGYQFNRHVAIELGYTDLGAVSASAPGVSASVDSKAFEVVGIGLLPLADTGFSLYAKLGIYSSSSDARASNGFSSLSESDSTTGVTGGLGVKFDITRNFAIRGEWQRYADVGGDNVGKSDMDVISVGALYRF